MPLVTAQSDKDGNSGFPFTSVTEFPFPHCGLVALVFPILEAFDSFPELVETVTLDEEDDWMATVLQSDDVSLRVDETASSAADEDAKPLAVPVSCSSRLPGLD